MLQARLNGLAMLYVHADMPLVNADIIDIFAKFHPRRMKFTNILESNSVMHNDITLFHTIKIILFIKLSMQQRC